MFLDVPTEQVELIKKEVEKREKIPFYKNAFFWTCVGVVILGVINFFI